MVSGKRIFLLEKKRFLLPFSMKTVFFGQNSNKRGGSEGQSIQIKQLRNKNGTPAA